MKRVARFSMAHCKYTNVSMQQLYAKSHVQAHLRSPPDRQKDPWTCWDLLRHELLRGSEVRELNWWPAD